ncbi:hypothetical protein ISR94_03200 [Candidatus Microgenomates bacterium]|nr:hypothetical protein [Candidatus Microgenomates bacterium]
MKKTDGYKVCIEHCKGGTTFGAGVVGFLKALVWPAYLINLPNHSHNFLPTKLYLLPTFGYLREKLL